MNKKTLTIAALVVVAVIVVAFFLGRASVSDVGTQTAGATPGGNAIEQYVPGVLYNGGIYSTLPIQTTSDITGVAGTFTGLVSQTGTFKLGSSGTTFASFNVGTTTLLGAGANTYSITASSTEPFDFACPGVTSNHVIDVWWHPTSTPSLAGSLSDWRILYPHASSTSGYCTITVANFTGVTASIPTDLASSTAYQALEPAN